METGGVINSEPILNQSSFRQGGVMNSESKPSQSVYGKGGVNDIIPSIESNNSSPIIQSGGVKESANNVTPAKNNVTDSPVTNKTLEQSQMNVQDLIIIDITRDRENKILKLGLYKKKKKKLDLTNTKLQKLDLNAADVPSNPPGYKPQNYPYSNAIGALLYLNNSTRPDISFSIDNLGRRQCNYGYTDRLEVQRVLEYIRNTADIGYN